MTKIFASLGLVLAITGCAPGEAAKSTDVPSEVTDTDPQLRPNQVCFPGQSGVRSCWDLVQRARLPQQSNLYIYPDPYTDESFPPSFSKAQYLPPDRLVDIRRIPADTRLAENFNRSEVLLEGSARGYYGVFSPAALSKIQNMRTNTAKLMTLTSAYRSPGHNSSVDGSARWSRHTYGDAIDFRIAGLSLKAAADQCRREGAAFTQIYTSHVHCDWRNLSLDPAMYPAALRDEIQPAHVGIHSEELGRIVEREIHTEAGVPTLVLETEVMKEDDGELLHEWEVITPSGEYLTFEGPTLSIPKVSGTFLIRVQVGGSLNFERNLTIP